MTSSSASYLYLLRHARSGWADPGRRDHERTLDERGRSEARKLGDLLRRRAIVFDAVVSSTATRARQTVEHLGESLCNKPARYSDDLYALGPEAYWAATRSIAGSGSLLIIGHNPTIETFALALDHTEPDALAAGFPTCGLAIFETPGALCDAVPGGLRLIEAVWP